MPIRGVQHVLDLGCREETAAVEELLRNVRDMHAALADAELARRTSNSTQPSVLPER